MLKLVKWCVWKWLWASTMILVTTNYQLHFNESAGWVTWRSAYSSAVTCRAAKLSAALLWRRISIKDFVNSIQGEIHTLIGSFKFKVRHWKQERMLCVDHKGGVYANDLLWFKAGAQKCQGGCYGWAGTYLCRQLAFLESLLLRSDRLEDGGILRIWENLSAPSMCAIAMIFFPITSEIRPNFAYIIWNNWFRWCIRLAWSRSLTGFECCDSLSGSWRTAREKGLLLKRPYTVGQLSLHSDMTHRSAPVEDVPDLSSSWFW